MCFFADRTHTYFSSSGVGSTVVIKNPQNCNNQYLADGTTVILNSGRSVIPVEDNHHFPARPIEAFGIDANGYILHDVQVEPTTNEKYESGCKGKMCDGQGIVVGQIVMQKCACMQMCKSEKVLFLWELACTMVDGGTFSAPFVSKHFMNSFIYSGPLPVNVRAKDFEEYEIEERLFESFRAVCEYINNHGGFQIFGWVKRGEIMDQGTEQPGSGLPHNAARTMIESGNLTYHIVRMEPMVPENIDLDELNALKFDVTRGFR